MLVEVKLVALYCVQEIVISNLDVDNVMFHVSCVTIIYPSAEFLNMILGRCQCAH